MATNMSKVFRSRIILVAVLLLTAGRLESSHAFVVSPSRRHGAAMRITTVPSSPSNRIICRATIATSTPPEALPLPPHTFAGQVEQAMMERFGGEANIERVLASWRWLEQDYEHRAYHGDKDMNPDDSLCHQHCHSYVPGLTVHEFWDNDAFDWTSKLAAKYKVIRQEFLDVTADMAALQTQGNNVWAGALTEDASSYGLGWKTLVLMDRSRWDAVNVNLFPQTAQAVHEAGVPAVEVFFASLQPDSIIKPHSDFTNFVLTSHLAIDIPYSGENKCRLRIGDTTRQWINGQLMVFDTSLLHDAVNESDQTRYILMMRVWHPDLTVVERQALQFIYDCLDFPDLLSTDATLRQRAEEQVAASRIFPQIQRKATARRKGFGGGGGGASSKNKKKKSKTR